MPLEGRATLYEYSKGKVVLYLPAAVVKDSAFPFKPGERLHVVIKGSRLIVEKSRGREAAP